MPGLLTFFCWAVVLAWPRPSLVAPLPDERYAEWLDNAAIVTAQLRPLVDRYPRDVCATRDVNDTAAIVDCDVNDALVRRETALAQE
jgi:hypothetical protein